MGKRRIMTDDDEEIDVVIEDTDQVNADLMKKLASLEQAMREKNDECDELKAAESEMPAKSTFSKIMRMSQAKGITVKSLRKDEDAPIEHTIVIGERICYLDKSTDEPVIKIKMYKATGSMDNVNVVFFSQAEWDALFEMKLLVDEAIRKNESMEHIRFKRMQAFEKAGGSSQPNYGKAYGFRAKKRFN